MAWVKALHIIAVICWFAALFYLPRLFVYHAMAEDKPGMERFKIMERKLYRGIMTPSMIVTLLSGFWLLWQWYPGFMQSGWMHVKLLCVGLLVVYHFVCRHFMLTFREDRNEKSHTFYRVFNEVPVVFLCIVVIMVVVKPF